jgi:hypothetical protein
VWRTRCSVLTSEGGDLPFVRALVKRVRWQKEKGNLPVQWNRPWPRENPSRRPGGDITPTEVAGLRVAYGVYRGGRRLWDGVPGRQVERGRGGGGSTAAVRGGGARVRTGVAAVLLLPPPFSTSRFPLLAVVSPWHVDSGTRSSPTARREENLVPLQLQSQTLYRQSAAKINQLRYLQLKNIIKAYFPFLVKTAMLLVLPRNRLACLPPTDPLKDRLTATSYLTRDHPIFVTSNFLPSVILTW